MAIFSIFQYQLRSGYNFQEMVRKITGGKEEHDLNSHTPSISGYQLVLPQQLSQFWYDDITAQALAEEALQASHNRSGERIIITLC